jgi:hypothetical protein
MFQFGDPGLPGYGPFGFIEGIWATHTAVKTAREMTTPSARHTITTTYQTGDEEEFPADGATTANHCSFTLALLVLRARNESLY